MVKRQRILENGINADNEWYNNVCVILDDNEELCTSFPYGFEYESNSPPYQIDFVFSKPKVKNVKLIFRENKPPEGQSGNYHAQVADLKIYYSDVHDNGTLK